MTAAVTAAGGNPEVVGGSGIRKTVKRRRRVVISCVECHRRKQKCDRESPCANCVSRGKQDSCTYDTTVSIAKKSNHDASSDPRYGQQPALKLQPQDRHPGEKQNTSTVALLQKMDMTKTEVGEDAYSLFQAVDLHSREDVKGKYKGYIRQLPAPVYMDKLLDIYFQYYNSQYWAVETRGFAELLAEWRSTPFSVLAKEGPRALSPDLAAMPALLFQMCAIGLLLLSEDVHPELDNLKYAANMTWEDVALEYSDTGLAIHELYCKKHLSLTAVTSALLYGAAQKLTGRVAKAWHLLGETIRLARELGIHSDSFDPKPRDCSAKSIIENEWIIQRRRNLYLVLTYCETHMSLMLGRPGVIDPEGPMPSLPMDTALPSLEETVPLAPRDTQNEVPTPIITALWTWELAVMLRRVQNVQRNCKWPEDREVVLAVHRELVSTEKRTPAIFQMENPDTRWDGHPDAPWIRSNRFWLNSTQQFAFMALHRSYMFHRPESRVEALKASVLILELHKKLFDTMPPISWNNHVLFFGAFDALVTIAAIYIFFPNQHPEARDKAKIHFDWTIERFAILEKRNTLAKAAQKVLRALQARLVRVIADNPGTDSGIGSVSSEESGFISETKEHEVGGGSADGNAASSHSGTSASTLEEVYNVSSTDLFTLPATRSDEEMQMGLDGFHWTNMAPLNAISDLSFQNLMAMPWTGSQDMGPDAADMGSFGGEVNSNTTDWQFGGRLGDDSFWQFLNNH